MNVRNMTETALMAAVIAVLSPLAVPLAGQVPISLATLAVMLAGIVLKEKYGTLAVVIYIVLGMIGMPVFAGWSSGASVVFGMTGGYIIGYLPLAWITGRAAAAAAKCTPYSYTKLITGALLGTLVLYVLGTVWFMAYTGMGPAASLSACVLPFLPGDALKIAAAALLAPRLEKIRK
ncbi:MAG: biotin transporter BioY [Solobacterium sp.]|nr:biotin transporter BioY [Solobacterium sp.]